MGGGDAAGVSGDSVTWRRAMSWAPTDAGATLGTRGSEDGPIIQDDEHEQGARITLEEKTTHAPFAITCGIYGWMFHTRYFSGKEEATIAYNAMKESLAGIISLIPASDDKNVEEKSRKVATLIEEFVREFP
jgi:hypothetical protein